MQFSVSFRYQDVSFQCKFSMSVSFQYLFSIQIFYRDVPISKKIDNDDNILKIGNHTYSFRKDILYTGEELKQLESDYQDIIAQLTISNEISLSSKIIKMSNILYNNQYKLKQKPIYNPIDFKIMLEIANKDLIGFFDKLYARKRYL